MDKVSRRDFMKTAAIGAAGVAALGAAQTAQAGEFSGKIKKAVKYGMVQGDMPALEKFQLVKDLGYDGIEPGVNDGDPDEMKAASDETGLPIHGVVNGSVNDINKAIDRAKFYGATSVLLVAGRVDEKTSYAQNYEDTQKIIKEAIPYAEEQDILLLVENVWNNFLLSPLEYARYLDELDSDHVGAYLDLGNMVRFGWPEHWIPVLGDRVKKLDVKEYDRQKQLDEGLWKGFDTKIGDGSVDWAAVRAELAKINYTGWATAEVSGGDRERLADVAARMDEVLDL